MPDKFNIAGVEFVLPADNTKVDVGTEELPKWKAPFTPNLEYGKEQYYKGNYLDPHAQAYASRISGKAESVSPEFEIMTMLGPKAAKELAWAFTKPAKEPIRRGFFKNITIKRGNTDFKFTGPTIHYQRVKNGSYKNLGLTKEQADDILDDLYNNTINLDNYNNYKELAKNLNIPNPMAKIIYDDNNNMFFYPLTKDSDGLIFYRGKNIDQETFNYLLPHEVHHGLSYKSFGKYGNPIDLPKIDKDKFLEQAEKEGIKKKNKYYSYMTKDGGEEMSARGVQLKDDLGITHDRLITTEELENLSKTYPDKFNNNMKAFFSLIGNDYKDWAKWLSSTATGYTGLMILNKNNEK